MLNNWFTHFYYILVNSLKFKFWTMWEKKKSLGCRIVTIRLSPLSIHYKLLSFQTYTLKSRILKLETLHFLWFSVKGQHRSTLQKMGLTLPPWVINRDCNLELQLRADVLSLEIIKVQRKGHSWSTLNTRQWLTLEMHTVK